MTDKGGKNKMECCYEGCCQDTRRFLTREEKIQKLAAYKKSLENEAKAVAEAIDDLSKE